MTPTPELRIVLVTVPNEQEGLKLAHGLVERRLAACVNIVPGVKSVYRWHNEIKVDPELLLIVKTREECIARVVETVKALHTYTLPETVSLPIVGGSAEYLHWVHEETQ